MLANARQVVRPGSVGVSSAKRFPRFIILVLVLVLFLSVFKEVQSAPRPQLDERGQTN
jgi:hypothetical protein